MADEKDPSGNIPGAETEEKDPQDFQRAGGLLVSEWVTYAMIAIVVAAVAFGFKVGGERDAAAERAVATLDALTAEAERVVSLGGTLVCDDSLLDADVLANDYLTFSVRPAPFDEDDESLGFGPALYVEVFEEQVSGDTWDTAKRFMALVKEADGELAEAEAGARSEAEADARERGAGSESETDADGEEDEPPPGRLRNVQQDGFLDDEAYLRYYVLASETAVCSADA